MKMKNHKRKIHPSPSSSSHSALSVLTLLPAAIIALISILSNQDKETLAYMLTRSLNSPKIEPKKKKNSNKLTPHKPPTFDCDCFECYTSYWSKWDTSANREIIHQAIEAFEESLSNNEKQRREKRGRKKEKPGQRKSTEVVPTEISIKEESFEVCSPVDGCSVVAGDADVAPPPAVGGGNRGLARKVLPDVMGILGSRLFSLWNPGG